MEEKILGFRKGNLNQWENPNSVAKYKFSILCVYSTWCVVKFICLSGCYASACGSRTKTSPGKAWARASVSHSRQWSRGQHKHTMLLLKLMLNPIPDCADTLQTPSFPDRSFFSDGEAAIWSDLDTRKPWKCHFYLDVVLEQIRWICQSRRKSRFRNSMAQEELPRFATTSYKTNSGTGPN